MGSYTSIQISSETRKKLLLFKDYTRETYDEVLNKLMKIVETIKKEGELSEEALKSIERGKEDIKKGRTYSTKEVLAMLEG
jgi:predicted transcriptional regulator